MNVFNKAALSIATGLVLLAAQPAISEANEIYKWTDDKGQVHFSQQPPEGRYSEQVLSKTPRSFGQNIERDPRNDESAIAPSVNNATIEDKPDSSQAAIEAAPQVIEKDADLCAKAQQSKQLILSKPIIRRDGKLLTIEQRNAELQYLEEVISIHC